MLEFLLIPVPLFKELFMDSTGDVVTAHRRWATAAAITATAALPTPPLHCWRLRTMLLLLTLLDERTKTQTWGCDAVKLTHIKLSCYFIRTVIDGNWIGSAAIGWVRYCYCWSWFIIQWKMNGRERRTSGTLHYSRTTDRYDWEDDSWGSFKKGKTHKIWSPGG